MNFWQQVQKKEKKQFFLINLIFILILLLCINFTEEKRYRRDSGSCVNNCSEHGSCQPDLTCICNDAWIGADCSISDIKLEANERISKIVSRREWHYYHGTLLPQSAVTLFAQLNINNETENDFEFGDCDLYIKFNSPPSKLDYDSKAIDLDSETRIALTNAQSGLWYFGVYGFQKCSYTFFWHYDEICKCGPHAYCNSFGQCTCETPYFGPNCGNQPLQLFSKSGYSSTVETNTLDYYMFILSKKATITIIINETNSGSTDLYIKYGELPAIQSNQYDYAKISSTKDYSIVLSNVAAGTWYIAVNGLETCDYEILVKIEESCPSKCSLHGTCNSGTCTCYSDYIGSDCEKRIPTLANNQVVSGYAAEYFWNYYHFSTSSALPLSIILTQKVNSIDCDLYIRSQIEPTLSHYDLAEQSKDINPTTLVLENPGTTTWFIGVYGFQTCNYSLEIQSTSNCPNGCSNNGVCNDISICNCNYGYYGVDCSLEIMQLIPVLVKHNSVKFSQWIYYNLTVEGSVIEIIVKEEETSSSLSVYVDKTIPTLAKYEWSATEESNIHRIHAVLPEKFNEAPNYIIIGIYGKDRSRNNNEIPFAIQSWISPF
eukprot:TRINITY_DN1702_c0_g3_i1.p1 TRINITY_DN1702_c0_g3~~TRINITY_DN1702_c0_g3_i1.p1  ORF type:complete len:601 (-),score=214.85 TRINITY_DN1702_c0_g3_i1:82-1884(-)